MTASTSITVTARVINEVSSGIIATTTPVITDLTWWQSIIHFFSSLF